MKSLINREDSQPRSRLYLLILLPIFIPTFGSTLVVGVEELPWFLILLPILGNFEKRFFLFFLLVLSIGLLQLIFFDLDNFNAISNLIKFLNFLAPIVLVRNRSKLEELGSVANFCVNLNIIVGLLQFTTMYHYFIPIHDLFFSRSTVIVDGSYRGISGFYSEPSRAGYYLVMCCLISAQSKLMRGAKQIHGESILLIKGLIILLLFHSVTTVLYFTFLVFYIYRNSLNFYLAGIIILIFGYNLIDLRGISEWNPKLNYLITALFDGEINVAGALQLVSGGRFYSMIEMTEQILIQPFGHLLSNDYLLMESSYSDTVVDGYREMYRNIPTSSIIFAIYLYGIMLAPLIYHKYKNLKQKKLALSFVIISTMYSPASSPLVLLFMNALNENK